MKCQPTSINMDSHIRQLLGGEQILALIYFEHKRKKKKKNMIGVKWKHDNLFLSVIEHCYILKYFGVDFALKGTNIALFDLAWVGTLNYRDHCCFK